MQENETAGQLAPMTPPTARKPPTVSRRMWFWPTPDETARLGMRVINPEQPFDAGVVFVWGAAEVNVTVTDHVGNVFAMQHVPVAYEGDERPTTVGYVTWMPYQNEKHRSEAAVESMLGLPVREASDPARLQEVNWNTAQRALAVAEAEKERAEGKGLTGAVYGDASLEATRHPGASLSDLGGNDSQAGQDTANQQLEQGGSSQ
jgi:hypothetical protein